MVNIKRWFMKVAITLAMLMALPGLALGQSREIVNQGRPGNEGPWWVIGWDYHPTATTTNLVASGTACTAASGATCTVVLASTEVINYEHLTITVRVSGANTVDNVLIEFSPDGPNWEVWDTGIFSGLTTLAIRSAAMHNSRRYLRIEARAAANTTVVVNITGNN